MAQLLTARCTTVALRIIEKLTPFIDDAGFFDPPIKNVWYGDQLLIPEVPAVCVEPSTKPRSWPPDPTDRTDIDLEVNLFVYNVRVGEEVDNQEVRLVTDRLAETVEEYLNLDRHLQNADGDDLVIYGYVLQNDSGYSLKGREGTTLYHSARLIWRGRSKLRLTQAQ